ncbi:vacuolar iron transporter homolog 1-like [Nymphaea colorata]|uniref:Vacuolar iron transporter n=1 Tax=Nymphaea colorata TaxID=210225 RepID=A0A5K1GWV5_9MAGN|nr:vacuolar iron transporter homolog 1-like [Nymphaea colorata]
MAAYLPSSVQLNQINHIVDKPGNSCPADTVAKEEPFDYSQRAQWLRAAALGANDGLVSVASLMLGVSAVNQSVKATVVSGLAGLIAGAFSMAIGEYVSVYSQVDIELAQMKRERRYADVEVSAEKEQEEKEKLPSPLQAAGASALAFGIGAVVPLLSGAFIKQRWTRVGVVSGVSTLALALFGWTAAKLGGSSVGKSTVRVVVGGWAAMLVTFGVLKLFGMAFKLDISQSA